MSLDHDMLVRLGIKPKNPPPKIKPRGKDYVACKKAIKLLNKFYRNKPYNPKKRDKWVGFFKNINNPNHEYIICTSCFYSESDVALENYKKIISKLYPNLNLTICHLYSRKVYFSWREGEGLYIT